MKDITAKRIQDKTKKDPLLQSVIQHIYNDIKPVSPELYHFKNIFDELTVSGQVYFYDNIVSSFLKVYKIMRLPKHIVWDILDVMA